MSKFNLKSYDTLNKCHYILNLHSLDNDTSNTCYQYLSIDDAFSTGTGLERIGIAGPIRWLKTSGSSSKTRTKRFRGGSPVASSMPKSALSGGREDQLLRE